MNYFADGSKRWNAKTLWAAASEIHPVNIETEVLLATGDKCPSSFTPRDLVEEVRRVTYADRSFPVVLTPEGHVCDGWHRVIQASVAGAATVRCVRLATMPKEDGIL